MVRLSARVPIREEVRKQPLRTGENINIPSGPRRHSDPEVLEPSRSPEPQELRQNRSDEAVDQDVGPHQLAGELEGLKARVVEQEEAGPQQQQIKEPHEA